LAGKAIDNRNKIITVDMVVDLRIGERIKEGLKTERKSNSNSSISASGSISSTAGGYERGQSNANFGESTLVVISEDFLYHENRFIATATKLKLTLGEAQEALSAQISRAIASSLP
ncbi:MAG: complement resistance protein TraT, partial [Lentisphaeraceae bacterium]|nr:complement resistance protein TraT [Lentisphaeraceae bacterium]